MLNLKEFAMWGFLVAAGVGLSYCKGHEDATNELTISHQAEQIAAARQLEAQREATQLALNTQSNAWQAHLAKSKELADRTIADLRSRGIRLQVKLNDSIVSCITSDGRSITDGRAELHPDTAGFLVEQAQRADAQVKGLQGVIKALQQGGSK